MGKRDKAEEEAAQAKYRTEGFQGAVILKSSFWDLSGKPYMGVIGTCTVVKDTDMVGFETKGTEANWLIRVEGQRRSVNLLGCQIRGVIEGTLDQDPLGREYLDLRNE